MNLILLFAWPLLIAGIFTAMCIGLILKKMATKEKNKTSKIIWGYTIEKVK